jgi:hypothetical protein
MRAMRRETLVLLMLGWALVLLLWNLQDVLERTAMCQVISTAEACCPSGGCKFIPAGDSRPAE